MHSENVVGRWAERSGEFSPRYYAHYGPNATSDLVRARLDAVVEPDAAVLELGCSSGRHLEHLRQHGYRDLHGVDVNGEAFDVMAETYPDLYDAGTFHAGSIAAEVGKFPDGRFEAVFSVETLQHVHPDRERAFDEVERVTDDLLVTAEIESPVNGDDASERDAGEHPSDDATAPDADENVNFVDDGLPLYYRNWNRVFAGRGFRQVEARDAGRDTLRVFEPADS